MASRTIIIDDIDGSEEASTRHFGVDGVDYEIDLSDANHDRLVESLRPFLDKARKTKGGKSVKRSSAGSSESALMRTWLIENGHDVPARGRLSQAQKDLYNAAH